LEELEMKKYLATLLILLFTAVFLVSCSFGGYSVLMMDENSGDAFWDARYERLNGFKQRVVTLSGDGEHEFSVDIVTTSGSLELTIEDSKGAPLYRSNELPSSSFKVGAQGSGKYVVRFDADDHNGSFDIRWK
jgi:hypothetical protein